MAILKSRLPYEIKKVTGFPHETSSEKALHCMHCQYVVRSGYFNDPSKGAPVATEIHDQRNIYLVITEGDLHPSTVVIQAATHS